MTLMALPADSRFRTMVDVFEWIATRGDQPAFTATSASGEVVRLGSAQLVDAIARAASALQANGVDRGAVVGIHLDNRAGLEALVLHWAAQWMGAVPTPLGTRLTLPEVAYIAGDADVVLVCSALDGLPLASQVVDQLPAARLLDCSAGLDALLAGHGQASPATLDEEDLADILYTSGTTGHPKGVELTHANNVAAGLELANGSSLTEGDVYQSAIPYFTSTGVHTNPLMCLVTGVHLVMEPTFDQFVVLERAAVEGTTTYLAAPSMLSLIMRDVDTTTAPPSLRSLIFGGSVMSAPTLLRLADAFPHCALTNLYGQTEAGPNGTVCMPADILRKAGSIGNQGMGPWTTFAVLDDAGAPAPVGDLGEIVLRSPSVMRGYRGKPEATATTLADGWLHTGDIGYVDDEGFLYYADRSKDLIIRGGMNISSAEVEAVLLTYPGVADAAVIAVDHEILGEDVLAVLVAPGGVDVDALRAYARTQLADYKAPRHVTFVDELPRNAMGKVLKRELRDDLGGTGPTASTP
ncbi:MAG TPA: AMP-binding protein [Acidimicrobiia bacterium]|nr:AMP-binding protein [Acidimicrobiia bacterium]